VSGGGGSGGVGPVGPTEDLACGALRFETSLASPDAAVVQGLTAGDVLALEIRPAGGRNAIVALADGVVAGAITERTADLLRCMQEGFQYVAEVTQIDGGWVDLAVRPA
jgi:hypothetical protein